jgi:hypothetical protein
MKKSLVLLALFGAVALMFPGSGDCATVTKSVASQAGIDVYGPGTSSLAPDSTEGMQQGAAVELSLPEDSTWAKPSTAVLSGAKWISTPLDSTMPDNYNMFSDSFPVSLPCTGYNLSGTVYTTANNSEVVYVNGSDPKGPFSDVTTAGSFTFIPAVGGENTLDFVVQTGAATGPVGLIYNAVISYDVPDAFFLPPITKSSRTLLKAGTTLPIKFVLKKDNKAIRTVQKIYVAVTGPGTEGVVARFDIGQGSTGLRFAKGNGQYITNFKTKDYPLTAGQQYTISVNDYCSGDILGSVQIQIQAPKPHGKH